MKKKLPFINLKKKKTNTYKSLSFGKFGLKITESGFITPHEYESIRRILSRKLKPVNGKYWFKQSYLIPLTYKSKGSRMGKGKGNISGHTRILKAGEIVIEFQGINSKEAIELLQKIRKKISLKSILIF